MGSEMNKVIKKLDRDYSKNNIRGRKTIKQISNKNPIRYNLYNK